MTVVLSPSAAANWVWLVDVARMRRAVVFATVGDPLAAGLRLHFDQVDHITAPDSVEWASSDFPPSDLVFVSHLGAWGGPPLSWLPRFLGAARVAICPRTPVVVRFANARWGHRLIGAAFQDGTASVRQVLRAFRSAGFGRVESYYLPSYPKDNGAIIPATAPAAVAFEGIQHMGSGLRQLRPLLGRTGLHGVLYPGAACVGYS